jgi:hypothetical protein
VKQGLGTRNTVWSATRSASFLPPTLEFLILLGQRVRLEHVHHVALGKDGKFIGEEDRFWLSAGVPVRRPGGGVPRLHESGELALAASLPSLHRKALPV